MNTTLITNPVEQNKAKDGLTSRYEHLSTMELINPLLSQGWSVTKTVVTNTRKQEHVGFQKHMVRLRNEALTGSILGLRDTNRSFPEIVVTNSHNGLSSAKVMLGIFRLVCSNGLVIGKSFGEVTVRHNKGAKENLLYGTERLLTLIPELTQRIQALQGKVMTADEQYEFARQAAVVRFDAEGKVTVDPKLFLMARRYEDQSNDAFTVFNRVQENIMKGGIKYLRHVVENGVETKVPASTRAIRNVNKTVDVNKELFETALKLVA